MQILFRTWGGHPKVVRAIPWITSAALLGLIWLIRPQIFDTTAGFALIGLGIIIPLITTPQRR